MGGSMDVENSLGEGSAFTIILSCEIRPRQSLMKMRTTKGTMLSGKRILIVDDQPLNVERAIRYLEKREMVCESASDGAGAVRLFDESDEDHFDAILMDTEMPDMSGIEATKRIRLLSRSDAMQVPVIAMSADMSADGDEIKGEVMDDFIKKPIKADALYTVLEKNIRK